MVIIILEERFKSNTCWLLTANLLIWQKIDSMIIRAKIVYVNKDHMW